MDLNSANSMNELGSESMHSNRVSREDYSMTDSTLVKPVIENQLMQSVLVPLAYRTVK